jgi:hypothetical protein
MRAGNLALGLWAALAATGCGRSGGVSFQASGERWHFVQDEKRLFFYGGTASTSAWDLVVRAVAMTLSRCQNDCSP